MGAGLSAYGRGTANILACSLETVVAEKMHAVIDHAGQISEVVTYLQERLLHRKAMHRFRASALSACSRNS